ncbi:hypothetical protein EC957_011343 [Mortierella hygrophila]|uniref:Inner kinetochore subunit AME1 domain-containing protein n=1 Tax=Mortierella hygrophila TaxID=979708 RepID=A0A9P6FHG7_9FUNG|nr:hypothetical protein EC957_011343 [Mortierella hygrophila]
MAPSDDGTDLAQKYKDKVQARKRGAGTHQSKFRNFTIGKSSNPNNDASASTATAVAAVVANNEDTMEKVAHTDVVRTRRNSRGIKNSTTLTTTTVTAKATRAAATATTSTESEVETISETTTAQRSIRRSSAKSTLAEGGALGLTERYQERMKTRIRGAGAHKPEYKGFTLKGIKSSKPTAGQVEQGEWSEGQTTEIDTDTTSASALADKEPRRTKSTPGPSHTTPLPGSTGPRRSTAGPRASTPSLKEMLAQPSTTIPISSSNRMTRASSRYTGQSPSFKIAWGKTLVVSESRRQEAAQARENGVATPATAPKNVAAPALPEAPATDNSALDDLEGFDGFGGGGMSPSPPRDMLTPEPERRENFPAKRKSASIIAPETTSAASDTTTATRKPSLVLAKRRRLIQEEVDENEEPLLSIKDHPKAAPKDTIRGRTTKPTTTTKESARDQPTKELATVAKASKAPYDIISRKASTKKPRQTGVTKAKSTGSSTTKPAKTSQNSLMPLKQTSLMQLNTQFSRTDLKDSSTSLASRNRGVTDDDSEDEREFEDMLQKQMSKGPSRKSSSKNTTAKKGKGPSRDTVKNYQQLQINCLKFFGPAAAIAKPAIVKNQAIGKKLPTEAEGEEVVAQGKKAVQSILQIERAPLSEMDVIAEAVRDVVNAYIDSVEDQAMVKNLQALRSELETRLIEQVDMLDDQSLLRASVKKAAAVKRELRVQLLETQRRRQRTRQELAKVRATFEREERARQRLEETHKFLTDLESLRDEVAGSDGENSEDDTSGQQTYGSSHDNVKTGLQSYIATVGARSGGAGAQDSTDTQPGMLGALVEFNRLLETMVKNTPTRVDVPGSRSDSDSSDYEL